MQGTVARVSIVILAVMEAHQAGQQKVISPGLSDNCLATVNHAFRGHKMQCHKSTQTMKVKCNDQVQNVLPIQNMLN